MSADKQKDKKEQDQKTESPAPEKKTGDIKLNTEASTPQDATSYKKEGETVGAEAPMIPPSEGTGVKDPLEHGASVYLPEDLKAKLPAEVRDAIAAGAPVLVIVERSGGTFIIKSTKTFQRGFAASKKAKMDEAEAAALKEDFKALLDIQQPLRDATKSAEDAARKADEDWHKLFKENKVLKQMHHKVKTRLQEVLKDIKDLHDKHNRQG